MPRFWPVLFVTFALAAPSWAEQIFGSYNVDLPDDLHIAECENCTTDQISLLWKPEINTEVLTAYYDYVDASGNDVMFGEALSHGIAGHLDLFNMPSGGKHSALTAKERHTLNCADFRAQWGYGLSDFDQTRNIGHCATPVGAIVYAVCRYFEEGTICANGINYLELNNALLDEQHASSRRLTQAWDHYENLPNLETERDLLSTLRPVGNVAKIEILLTKITPRNGD